MIGKKIANIRKRKEITQEQLAEMINVSKNHLSAVERGVKKPPLKLMVGIAKALGVSVEQIFKDGD